MPIRRLALALIVAAVTVLGGCSESDSALEPSASPDDDQPADRDEPIAEDPAARERDDAIELLVSQGISADGAACIIDEVLAGGVDSSELDQLAGLVVDPELQEAVAFASANCLDADDVAQLPDEAFDLSNPVVRREFVESFSITSGFSIEVSECVVDELIEAGFDARDAFGGSSGELDDAVLRLISDAVESCA